jgi:hypothetical protein
MSHGLDMYFKSWRLLPLLWTALCVLQLGSATKLFESKSLNNCMKGSAFSASLFHVTFTPNNRSIAYSVKGFSEISAYVVLDVKVWIYGYELQIDALKKPIDPCEGTKDEKTGKVAPKFAGLCPMNAADMEMNSNYNMEPPDPSKPDDDVMKRIPGMSHWTKHENIYIDILDS